LLISTQSNISSQVQVALEARPTSITDESVPQAVVIFINTLVTIIQTFSGFCQAKEIALANHGVSFTSTILLDSFGSKFLHLIIFLIVYPTGRYFATSGYLY
jgi:hypothetical protein